MPAVFIVYYICPAKARNGFLVLASLLFYAWGEPVYILVMLFSAVFNYFCGIAIYMSKEAFKPARAKIMLLISITGNLSILFFFKYTDFFIQIVNSISLKNIPSPGIALPIGISFYTFQTMSYVIDVYRGDATVQKNITSFTMYVCMFPQLIAGPVVRYRQIADEIKSRKLYSKNTALGLQRFITGLGKKVIFANQAGALWDEIYQVQYQAQDTGMSVMLAWTGAIAYTFQIYFDFSGYSDMAIGMGQMLGFNFPENFNYPYQSESITDFWRRWHISLGTWFKEYVYIPLGGSKKGILRQAASLFIVWTLTGLWHGAAWNFVIWGIYFFVLLFLEKCFMLKILKKLPVFARHIYAMFFIVAGWVIFACGDFKILGGYFKAMAGINVPLFNNLAIYKLYTNAILLLIMAAASTKLPRYILFKMRAVFIENNQGKDRLFFESIHFFTASVFSFVILAVSMALLVSGSYNPFLYFRF